MIDPKAFHGGYNQIFTNTDLIWWKESLKHKDRTCSDFFITRVRVLDLVQLFTWNLYVFQSNHVLKGLMIVYFSLLIFLVFHRCDETVYCLCVRKPTLSSDRWQRLLLNFLISSAQTSDQRICDSDFRKAKVSFGAAAALSKEHSCWRMVALRGYQVLMISLQSMWKYRVSPSNPVNWWPNLIWTGEKQRVVTMESIASSTSEMANALLFSKKLSISSLINMSLFSPSER